MLNTPSSHPLRDPRTSGVLRTLVESGPLSQIDLAAATVTDKTAIVYLLDELERRGLLRRVGSLADRRLFLVHLTSAGRKTQQRAAASLTEQADTLLQPLQANERRLLVELLTRIADRWEARRQKLTTPPDVSSTTRSTRGSPG